MECRGYLRASTKKISIIITLSLRNSPLLYLHKKHYLLDGFCSFLYSAPMNNMAIYKIQSIGEKLPLARFEKTLNRFSKVLNYAFKGGVLTLGMAPLCPGPFRIILESGDLQQVESLQLTADELIINDALAISYDESHAWKVVEPDKTQDFATLKPVVKESFDLYRQGLSEVSMAFFLISNAAPLKGFDEELRKTFQLGLLKLEQENSPEFVPLFKGRGKGLTPSGDDFLCGYLLALGWLEKQGLGDFADLREALYKAALGTNILVNSFLFQSYKFWLDADWQDFFNAFACSDLNEVSHTQKRILGYGATSGADLLYGVYMALSKHLNLQGFKEAG